MTATTAATSPRRRRGFTLVEVLVAMALIIFIMVILTEAFTAGTGVFRNLKSQGDMQEKLRAVGGMVRNDIRQSNKQSFFDSADPPKLSAPVSVGNRLGGYFYVQQPVAQPFTGPLQLATFVEGTDGLGVSSNRMNTADAALCFTIRRQGSNQPQDLFAGRIPGEFDYPASGLPNFLPIESAFFDPVLLQTLVPLASIPGADYQPWLPPLQTTAQGQTQIAAQAAAGVPQFRPQAPAPQAQASGMLLSPWTEVGYFLWPTGNSAGTTAGQQMPLFTLRRRVRVVLNDQKTLNALNTTMRIPAALWGPRYAEVSCLPDASGNIYFNTTKDVVNPAPVAAGPPPQVAVPAGGPGGQAMTVPTFPLPSPQQQSLAPLTTNTQGQASWNGDDIVLTDVVSFNVRILAKDNTNFYSTRFPANQGLLGSNQGQTSWQASNPPDFIDVAVANAYYPTPNNPVPPPGAAITVTMPAAPTAVFNTGSTAAGGNNDPTTGQPFYLIQAVEITIRVWDVKTSQTRQVTIIQDM